jgi:protein TonB
MEAVSRAGAQPPAPKVAAEFAVPELKELRKKKSGGGGTIYVDDNGLFRRMGDTNSLVEPLPGADAPMETRVSEADQTRSSAPLEAELMRAAGRPYSGAFESESVEVQEPKSKENKMRNLVLAGAVTTVVMFGFQMIRAGLTVRNASAAHAATATTPAAPPKAAPQSAHPVTASGAQAQVIHLSTADAPRPANQRPAAAVPAVQSQMMHDQLTAPHLISQNVKMAGLPEAPPASDLNVAGVDGSNGAAMGGVFNGHARPMVTTVPVKPVNISAGVAVGLLIKKTDPAYPAIAKTARVSGTVVISAMITKTGALANLKAVSGPAMLRQAALDAVRTWRYKPYQLNNEPVEVETTVNVVFTLG